MLLGDAERAVAPDTPSPILPPSRSDAESMPTILAPRRCSRRCGAAVPTRTGERTVLHRCRQPPSRSAAARRATSSSTTHSSRAATPSCVGCRTGAGSSSTSGAYNGTFVNGRRVDEAVLDPLDLVGIGRSEFRCTAASTLEQIEARTDGRARRGRHHGDDARGRRARRRRRLRARGGLAARSGRALGRGEVDAARRADRVEAGAAGERLLRRPRPLRAVRRASPAHRLRPAGRRRPSRAQCRAVARTTRPSSASRPT